MSTGIGFWKKAALDPARIALVTPEGIAVTNGELLAAANRMSHGLRARSVPGDTIAVALGGRAFVEVYLAAMQIGLQLVPLGAEPTPETPALIAEAGARLVIGTGGIAPELLAAGQPSEPPADRKLGGVVFVTSGTTGAPRAIRRALPDLVPDRASAFAARQRLAAIEPYVDDDTVHLAVGPLHHSATLGWCSAHLHCGHRVVLAGQWSSENVLALIARHRITSTFMVPTHFVRLLACPVAGEADTSSLRAVVHGGAPCAPELKRAMIGWLGPILTEVYGAAELPVGTSVSTADWLAHPGTVGRSERVAVLRDDGARCAANEIGEVAFLLNDAPRTVGDLGYVDAGGWLYLSGRKGEVIISGGANVHPTEVEDALASHHAVGDVAVFGVPDPEWGERIVATIAPIPPDPEATRAELLAHCRARIAAWKCPRVIAFAAALPRTELGKLQRRVLRAEWR